MSREAQFILDVHETEAAHALQALVRVPRRRYPLPISIRWIKLCVKRS